MKKYLAALAMTAAIVMTTASCTKEGVSRFNGNYTFKTSGTVTVTAAGAEDDGAETITLSSEAGQMSVVTSDRSEGEMIVAMNILGGNVITFNAKADGKTLTVEPFTRTLTLRVSPILTDILTATATVTVSGTAERYDGSLLFDLTYEGGYTFEGTDYTIVSSDVQCWARSID